MKMKTICLFLLLTYVTVVSANSDSKTFNDKKIESLKAENDSLKQLLTKKVYDMKQEIIISLTFQKSDAEQAMNFYVDLFDNSRIIDIHRWGKDGPGKEGTIMQAKFELNGVKFMCSDSPPIHNWTFTPAIAVYVECENEKDIERLFSKLSENGAIAMPLDNYGFSQKFGWVVDKFGISWQLNLNN
jgi:predicted 3-demethylubiquinone-9 3-methyltransferase (glyoxalase superfamily)